MVGQLTQQLASVLDRLTQVETQLGNSTRLNRTQEVQLAELNQRLLVTERQGQGGGGGGHADLRGGLYDKKLNLPMSLKDGKDFREWADDFFDWVEDCDAEVSALMTAAAREKAVITERGANPAIVAKAKHLYRWMKKSIDLKSARQIVLLCQGKNPYEAWRLLHAKFAPNNDASAGAIVDKLVDWKSWRCKTIAEVPMTIAAWERLIEEYRREFHQEPINDITKRQIVKNILPEDVRHFLETQTMLREDLTYDQIKDCANNMAQKVAKVAIPMDLSLFKESPSSPDGPGSPVVPAEGAPLDSFGKGPVGGQKPGKGGGKAEKGKGKGEETRECHKCGKKGHIARDCWSKPQNKGKGDKGVGKRARGKDGKWYKRTGVNSWEEDPDQQDSEEPAEETGLASTGAFTSLGLGSGLDDEEDDGFKGLNSLDGVSAENVEPPPTPVGTRKRAGNSRQRRLGVEFSGPILCRDPGCECDIEDDGTSSISMFEGDGVERVLTPEQSKAMEEFATQYVQKMAKSHAPHRGKAERANLL